MEKSIDIGNEAWLIRDEGVLTPLIDCITEVRHSNGIVHLGLGKSVIDATNPPEVHMQARPCMTVATAKQLRARLDQAIAEAERS